MTIDALKQRAAQLWREMQTLRTGEALPPPTADFDAERAIVAAHLADVEARKRVLGRQCKGKICTACTNF